MAVASVVRVQPFFAKVWMLVSEVYFQSCSASDAFGALSNGMTPTPDDRNQFVDDLVSKLLEDDKLQINLLKTIGV